MKRFKISIPKPCHEDWSKMTPKEKGRFCASCSKTVIDFTKKSTTEIQEYLIENRSKRVCGYFYRKQLDSIVLQIPKDTFQQQLSFQRLFILTLLFVMGTTLFSCKTDNGNVQKIDKVELIDTIVSTEKTINTITQEGFPIILGELPKPTISCKKDTSSVVETIGEVVEGDEIIIKSTEPYSIDFVDVPPRFKETKNLNKEFLSKEFDDNMKEFVLQNFNISFANNLSLPKGKKRIMVKFVITEQGTINDIQVRAPHPLLKKKLIKIFEKLPSFIPAIKDDENVSVYYTQPINFVVN